MNANEELIRRFYTAFQQGDFKTMQSCYHDSATFYDPVFQDLDSREVRSMWQMLVTSATDLKVAASQVTLSGEKGGCRWDAWYTFSRTGRPVHNIIIAEMTFRTASSSAMLTLLIFGDGQGRRWEFQASCWVGAPL